MGVARKVTANVAKPKKKTVAKPKKDPVSRQKDSKTAKKASAPVKTKAVGEKKSLRIQNLKVKSEPEPVNSNTKPKKKLAQKPSSPEGKALTRQQKSAPQTIKQTQKKSAQKTNSLPQKKKSPAVKPQNSTSSAAENSIVVKSSADAKKAAKSKNSVKPTPKPADPTVNVVKTLAAKKSDRNVKVKPPGKSPVSQSPSVASKLQKKKRKSPKTPLKKTLDGKITKSKRSLLSKAATPVGGKKKLKSSKSQRKLADKLNRGVVYFSHLPHGFYENELKKYCGQFGQVTGVYVPRSVNGNSKGFAFVEFKHPEVAEVVADTMNNYLMFTRLVKAELVPLERQKPWIFRNGKSGSQLAKDRRAAALAARQRPLTPEEEEAYKKKALARVEALKKKISEKGINLDFTVAS